MTQHHTSVSKRWLFSLLALAGPALLPAQVTTVSVTNTQIQSPIKRFGINLGTPNFYDSGQMTKNLVYTTNPSFEGEIYQSLIQCGSGTTNSCADTNLYAGFTPGFWSNASYTMITGTSAGRSGTICGFSGSNYPQNGGVYTFCDSGTAPDVGDYMLVRTTVPTDVGWPIGGDWLTIVGGGTFTAETTDLPPGTLGKQSGLLTAPTGSDSVSVNMFFDSTVDKSFVQLNGSYTVTFKAKGVAGNKNVAVSLTRGTNTFFTQTLALTNSWATYTIPFTGTENGSALGKVKLAFAAAGPDTIELDDVSLTKNGGDPANTTIFTDEAVQALAGLHPGLIRYWVDQLGDSLDNLLAPATGRQRSGYTPYAGFDGTNITIVDGGTPPRIGTFQTQSLKVGLTEFLQLCKLLGADPWIVVPSTFTTGEAYNLMDYLAGDGFTTYGAKRIAAGQTAPWTSVFNVIHLELGNEEWNGGTFKGGALETGNLPYSPYGQRASAIFAAMKGNPGYSPAKYNLIINGQSASPYSNYFTQLFATNNDSFSIAPYMMYNVSSWSTVDKLFGSTFAEAEAFVTAGASAEGVGPAVPYAGSDPYITAEQVSTRKPIVTSEMGLSPTGTPPSGGDGPLTQAVMNGYASSVGSGLAVVDSMFQQLRAGVLTQNLFALPGWQVATATNTTAFLWGAVVDMGSTNLKRPVYLALELANNAIGNKTQMLQTQHTGANPTDNQYGYGLNSVTLPSFHFLQSFAFTDGAGSYSLVVFNVSPDYSQPINFGGANQPTGTVTVQQLTSANITDTNETSNTVQISSPAFSSTMTLPAYSMTVFSWGSGAPVAPQISGVTTTGTTANSTTVTWSTDQPSTSQVFYGTTTGYGSQSALNSTLVTSHSVTITGLNPGTLYDFDVVSTNSSSQSTTSPNATFTTTAVPPVISAVTTTGITNTTATINWTTDQSSSSQVSYGTTTSYGSQSALDSALVTAHSAALTGLTPGTTYDFAVISTNGSGGTTTSSNFTFTTTGSAPPVISAVTATAITSTSATITWTTNQASSSQVNYGTTTAYGTQSALDSTLVTSHSVTITGLTPATLYDFDVVSTNSSSVSTTSPNATFTTTAVPPVISAVVANAITATSATINWTTDQASSSQVNYGTTTAYGSQSALNSTLTTTHSVALTGLTPGTTYNFDVVSANSSSASATSGNFTFATPTSSGPVITGVSTYPIADTTANIHWETDVNATSQVNYGLTSAYGSSLTLNGTLGIYHNVLLTGLAPGTIYHYAIVTANAAGGATTSPDATFTTSGTPLISAVTATAITTTSATITWTTDQPTTSLVNYGTTTAYGSQSTLNSTLVTSHSVVLTGLTPGTTYNYDVASTNSSNTSATSPNATFATPTSSGPAISAVTATGITTASATITWTTDQPSSSQVNYGTTTAYGSQSTLNSALVTSHSVTITGLTQGTLYDFDVVSVNSSSLSTTSANATFTTTAVGPVISAVTATGITTTSATITWTTDQPSSSQVNYGTTTAYGSQSTLNSALVTSHSVTITGLTQGTLYDFDVVSANASSLSSTSPNATFTTTAVAPVISAVTATAITSTAATITWTTDQPSSSQVSYGTTMVYGSQSTFNGALVTSHSVTITGLTPGTLYNFDVFSANSSNLSATSPNATFTTTAVGPAISAVTATAITSTSATITWTTDQPSSSQVSYGTTTSYGSQSTLNSTLVTSHSVTITGLTPGTLYDFDVVSTNTSSLSTTSPNATFTTTAVAPVISAVASTGITTTSATITWTTDQPSSSQVNYGTTTAYGSQSTLNSALVTSHSVTITGLTQGTLYDFDVVSTNSSSLTATSPNATFTTTAVAPVISAVASTGITTTSATITWTTDQPSSSQVNYGTTTAYGSQSALNSALVTSHSVTITGLTQGTLYDFDVVSTNSSSLTATSTNATFTTTAVAPVISAVASTGITTTSATITWTTDQPSSSQVNYGTTTAYGSQSALNSTLVTAHSVTITGLTPGTLYDFDVVSTNSSSLTATSPNATFTTTAVAPVISAVTATAITTTSATITWTTDQASSSQVNYGTTTAYGSQSTLNSALVTSHSVTITGLTQGTLYDFDVVSTNSSSLTATSANSTFTTTAVAPVISAVTATAITTTSATITWTTDQASSSQVNYGTTTAYGSQSALNSTLVTAHSVTISGLTPGTLYDFDVVSTNGSSLSTTSANSTFTTTAVAPVISAVTATAITSTSATITWTTDQASSSQVNYGTTTAYGSQSALNSTLVTAHSVTISGLTPGTLYDFDVVSVNGSSLSTTSPNATFTTTAVAPVISAVTATAITSTSATITWTTDQASSSQVNYGTTTGYGSQSALNSTLVTSHSVTISGLTPGTLYDFDVVSTNSSSLSATSVNSTFNTAPPPAISAVTATAITTTSATITWTTDQPSSSQVNYGTTTAYGSQSPLNSALVTSHSVTLTGLTPATLYDFDVVSVNGSNASATSTNSTFTTTTPAPPVISGVTATGISSSSATITWTTDETSSSQVAYGTTPAYGLQSPLNGALLTSHSVTLTGLTSGTTYNYAVTSVNGYAGSTTSVNFTFTATVTPPPVLTSEGAWPVTDTTATILWTSDQPSTSQVKYGTTPAYGSQSALNSSLALYHVLPIAGLMPGTTYNFSVMSTNSSGVTTTSGNFTFTTTGAAPMLFTAVTATNITSTSATITWTTSQASTTQVAYGPTTTYGILSSLDTSMVLSHSVTLTGLTPNTTYNYVALSNNAAVPAGVSANFTFPTAGPGGVSAPVISFVTATGITPSSATITWTTDQPASDQVEYGTTTSYGSVSTLGNTLVTSHSVTLTGLTQGTTYNYAAMSTNGSAMSTTSANFTFTTSTSSSPAPVITNVASWPVTGTTATILWTTDQNTTSQVNYGATSSYGIQSDLTSTLGLYHTVLLTGLTPGTTYNYSVVSTNSSGVTSTSSNFSFTTSGTAPMVFSAVTATNITSTAATITWTTSQASSTQVGYGTTTAYGSLSTLNTALVTSHSVTLTGLNPGTIYNYVALSNNASVPAGASANLTFVTSSGGSAPVISLVTATGITSTSATITWATDQVSSSQVTYGTTTSYGTLSPLNAALVTSHSVTLTGLTPGTTYNYAAISTNSSSLSTTSGNFTFTTPTSSSPAPIITNVASWPVADTTASILWVTDQNTTSQVNYGLTTAYGIQSALNNTLGLYHVVPLTGLIPGTTYNYQVVSTNGSGVTSTSANFTFQTTGTAPSQPAPVISGITATAITSTSATITWTTDETSTTQVAYGITTAYGSLSALNGSLVTAHSMTLTGLTPATIYDYAVTSTNGSGISTTSVNFMFTTASIPINPPVISAVAATNITGTSATITWTTDQTSSSQAEYGTTTAYGSLSALSNTLVTSHSVTITGLTAGTTYNYAVMSTNTGSMQATSANFTFATPLTTFSSAYVTGQTLGSLRSYSNSCNGFVFTVGSSNITITNLGRWVLFGNTGTHNVTIQTMSGTPIVSTSVSTSGQTAGQYVWGSVTPTQLLANTAYWIGSTETYPGDQWLDDNTTVTVGPAATIVGSAYAAACPGAPSLNMGGQHVYGPVNFQYSIP